MTTVDKIALMVTASCSVILVTIVVSPLLTGRPLSEAKALMAADLVKSFITIVALYVGSKLAPGG